MYTTHVSNQYRVSPIVSVSKRVITTKHEGMYLCIYALICCRRLDLASSTTLERAAVAVGTA
jgi:hypothetical protein